MQTATQTVTVETVEQLQSLTPAQVVTAYSGKDGKCCCGCAGTHYDARQDPKHLTQTTRILRQVQLLAAEGVEVDFSSSYVAAVKGTRLYIVYLAD